MYDIADKDGSEYNEYNEDDQYTFWKNSPLTKIELKKYLSTFHDVISKFMYTNKKFPKDDLSYILIGYVYDKREDKYAFEFIFDPISPDEEFMELYQNGELDDSDVDIFSDLFYDVNTLLKTCRKFAKYYMKWIDKNRLEYDD